MAHNFRSHRYAVITYTQFFRRSHIHKFWKLNRSSRVIITHIYDRQDLRCWKPHSRQQISCTFIKAFFYMSCFFYYFLAQIPGNSYRYRAYFVQRMWGVAIWGLGTWPDIWIGKLMNLNHKKRGKSYQFPTIESKVGPLMAKFSFEFIFSLFRYWLTC